MGKTLDFSGLTDPDKLAVEIARTWETYNMYRANWLTEKRELRNYIFATDTRSTSNSSLPWKNNTTLPKLCQIRDNLHANYMAALFPAQDWMKWEGNDAKSEEKDKRVAIQAYMQNKVEASNYKTTMSQLIYDYIDYGNAFATTEWIEEKTTDPVTGEQIQGYVGPKLVRISPNDLVFNPTTTDFNQTPKIHRSIKSLGEVISEFENQPNEDSKKIAEHALDRAKNTRRRFDDISASDVAKLEAYRVDGFGDIKSYYQSGLVEILQFFGTIYDIDNNKLYEDHIITVIDRAYVISIKPNPSWRKNNSIKHVGWRLRPDNLYAQGPLDNLVGMQYRIDHLENLKADAFDLIAFPVLKIKGYVEDFDYGPNQRIYVGDEGDVEFMHPDAVALSANTDIERLEQKMEEMAGAPREAMGIRTAGEKTAFEVSSLQTAASRIFENKARYFEEMMIDSTLNDMLELSRRNMPVSDLVRVMDNDLGVVNFLKITRDDIAGSGRLKPVGAAHFAKRNQIIQNLTQFSNSALGQDPAVTNHISGKGLAYLVEDLFGLGAYDLVTDNVRIMEQMESQRLINSAQQQLDVENITPAGLAEGDI